MGSRRCTRWWVSGQAATRRREARAAPVQAASHACLCRPRPSSDLSPSRPSRSSGSGFRKRKQSLQLLSMLGLAAPPLQCTQREGFCDCGTACGVVARRAGGRQPLLLTLAFASSFCDGARCAKCMTLLCLNAIVQL